jgi:hypothetical protein
MKKEFVIPYLSIAVLYWFSLLWRIEDSGPIAAYLLGRALMWPFQLLKFIF